MNATSTKHITSPKAFKSVRAKNVFVSQSMNGVAVNFMKPQNPNVPLELAGFEFQGDINVKHLIVRSLNGWNISAVLANAFLSNVSNTIAGNLLVHNQLNVDELSVAAVSDVPVEDLMTTSTQQVLRGEVFINMFHSGILNTSTINDEKLSQIVAVQNEANVIEGKEVGSLGW